MFLLVRETEDDFWPLNLDSLDDKSVPVSFRALEYHDCMFRPTLDAFDQFSFEQSVTQWRCCCCDDQTVE